jgi:hypothetical protein
MELEKNIGVHRRVTFFFCFPSAYRRLFKRLSGPQSGQKLFSNAIRPNAIGPNVIGPAGNRPQPTR